MSSSSSRPTVPSYDFQQPLRSASDLREKISSRRRSRSSSYSPPKPPSHPSRHVSRSVSKHRREMSGPQSPSKSRSVTTVNRHKSKKNDRSRSRSRKKVKSKSRKSHHHRMKSSSKRKSKRKSRSSSSSSSDRETSKSRPKAKSLKKTIVSLLQEVDEDRRDVERREVRLRTKSGESNSSRDEPSTSVTRITDPVSLQPNPIQPREEFKPIVEAEVNLPGYRKCQICSTYYPMKEEDERQHLSQHPDRLFRVNVPTDTFFYNIEEVIKHLARMKFESSQLKEKVAQCNLLILPSNLRGFSCDICRRLDTNDETVFLGHVREECQVRDKAERLKSHLICFCRGCQGRFSHKEELEDHVKAGPCWPRKMTINRLYDEVKHETPLSAAPSPAQMVRIKQEQVEGGVTGSAPAPAPVPAQASAPAPARVSVKREIVEAAARRNSYQLPATSSFNTPEPPVLPYSQIPPYQVNPNVFPSPVTPAPPAFPGQFPGQFPYPPPPVGPLNYAQFSQPPPTVAHSGYPASLPTLPPNLPSLHDLMHLQPANTSERVRSGPNLPTYSNYGTVIKSESGQAVGQPEPNLVSPAFSPLKVRSSGLAPPAPAMPLPSANDLFAGPGERPKSRSRSGSTEELMELTKSASSLSCRRLLCNWTDPHVDSCKRLRILKRCEKGDCKPGDLHALYLRSTDNKSGLTLCQSLQFECNGSRRNKEMKRIPLECPHSYKPDKSCSEGPTVSMRLLYRRTSQSLRDPRLTSKDYARTNQAAKMVRSKAREGGWTVETLISTWAAVSMVKVVPGDNPHVQPVYSDHDSDLECLD